MTLPIFRLMITYYVMAIEPAAADHERSLCQPTEIEIASCDLKSAQGKTASLCANIEKGTASYFFGTKEQVELNIEFSATRKIYRWLDPSTYTTFLGFNNGGHSYIFGIPQETLGANAFFYVKKSKDPLDFNTPMICTQNSFGEKNLAIKAISDVADEIVRQGDYLFPPD